MPEQRRPPSIRRHTAEKVRHRWTKVLALLPIDPHPVGPAPGRLSR
ncbi:hypothetical protein [Kibdelosporangium philippinense]